MTRCYGIFKFYIIIAYPNLNKLIKHGKTFFKTFNNSLLIGELRIKMQFFMAISLSSTKQKD